jgi:uncharacterized protein YacL
VKNIQALFFITALVLAVFGAVTIMRMDQNPQMKTINIIYALLMFGDTLAMLLFGLFIDRKIRAVFWLALLVLGLNITLTIFDQFGLVDFLFTLLNFAIFMALLSRRKEILPQ